MGNFHTEQVLMGAKWHRQNMAPVKPLNYAELNTCSNGAIHFVRLIGENRMVAYSSLEKKLLNVTPCGQKLCSFLVSLYVKAVTLCR